MNWAARLHKLRSKSLKIKRSIMVAVIRIRMDKYGRNLPYKLKPEEPSSTHENKKTSLLKNYLDEELKLEKKSHKTIIS
jgi:hypothetical protein